MLVAWSTNVAIISGFVGSALTVLVVLAAYGGRATDGVWRISFGIGIVVSHKVPLEHTINPGFQS